jgi:hypothetical protein
VGEIIPEWWATSSGISRLMMYACLISSRGSSAAHAEAGDLISGRILRAASRRNSRIRQRKEAANRGGLSSDLATLGGWLKRRH